MSAITMRTRLGNLLRSLAEPVVRLLFGAKLKRDPSFEYAACLMLKPRRLSLQRVELEDLFEQPVPAVSIERLPRGSWSSPVVDMVAMARIVAAAQPRRALELGSFRGYTAAAIAAHLPSAGQLVTVDIDPQHGSVYRDSALAARIERRIGTIDEQTAHEPDASFDLVFVDADHRYEAARSDTEAVLRLLKPDGWLLWHDYSNWGYFSGACGVPEYLAELSRERPVVHLAGTNIAAHRPCWAQGEGQAELERAVDAMTQRNRGGAWQTQVARP